MTSHFSAIHYYRKGQNRLHFVLVNAGKVSVTVPNFMESFVKQHFNKEFDVVERKI